MKKIVAYTTIYGFCAIGLLFGISGYCDSYLNKDRCLDSGGRVDQYNNPIPEDITCSEWAGFPEGKRHALLGIIFCYVPGRWLLYFIVSIIYFINIHKILKQKSSSVKQGE